MKKVLLLMIAVFTVAIINAQVIQSNDFDSYTAGAHMAQSDSINWTTWSNLPGSAEDGYISSVQASSGTNSLMISKDNDQVWILGDSTTGKYELSFKIYVPADSTAYFNVLHKFAGGASEWSNECYILPHDSSFRLYVGGNDTAHILFTFDTWHTIKYGVDLSSDFVYMMYDTDTVFSWPWSLDGSGNTGLVQIGAMDFYGYDLYSAGNVRLYVDDVKFENIVNVATKDLKESSSLKMFPNPVSDVLNIRTSKTMKTAKILDMSGSVIKSYNVNDRNFQINVENLASGLYYIQMNFGTSIAVRKFVKR